jgi:hypothetical protein
MSYKYKAKNGLDFFVPGVGRSTNGILESAQEIIDCPAIEQVQDGQAPVEAAQVAQPGAVIGVAPQATVTPQPAPAPEQAPVQAVAPTPVQPEQQTTNTEELK